MKKLLEINAYKEKLAVFITNTTNMVWKALDENKNLTWGCSKELCDIDHGTYPYVTSSNTISAGSCTGLGLSPKDVGIVTGITKSLTVQELEMDLSIRRFWCWWRQNGWDWKKSLEQQTGEEEEDVVGLMQLQLKHAGRLNGCDQLALMKLDVLDGFP